MDSLKTCLVAVAGLVILCAAVLLMVPAESRGVNIEPVVVTNTPAQPVPTIAQGTTSIAGTVQAQQSGAWSVNVKEPLSVTIANTPTVNARLLSADTLVVRSADDSSRVPFERGGVFSMGPGEMTGQIDFALPPGKRFVIEYVSARVSRITGQGVLLGVDTTAGGIAAPLFPLTPQGSGGDSSEILVAGQQTRLYADQGFVSIFLNREQTTGSVVAIGHISGYLVDLAP